MVFDLVVDETRALWLAAVHEVSRAVGVVAGPVVGRNYYRVVVDGATAVLLNAEAKLVAAADADERHEMELTFAEAPGGDVFERYGFRVATVAELEQPVNYAALSASERRDVDYHGATRVGDVLFNWFDQVPGRCECPVKGASGWAAVPNSDPVWTEALRSVLNSGDLLDVAV